jgi:hypothetical protein
MPGSEHIQQELELARPLIKAALDLENVDGSTTELLIFLKVVRRYREKLWDLRNPRSDKCNRD